MNFLNFFTGLYHPDSGNIRVDGKLLDSSSYQSYRELFSLIFTNFHLFEKLYGVNSVKDQIKHS